MKTRQEEVIIRAKRGNMALKEMILLFLSLITLFQGFKADQCDPKPMIIRHEGKKPCVYLDTKNIKTIGVGYNMQNKDAPEVFDSIGADYNKFENGPVTRWNVPCNCSSVPCLTEEQIEELLDISLKTAIADARTVIATFDGLCCSVQNVMVDMSFTLGGPGFAQFTTFATLLTRQHWKAAGDDLTVSLWCKQATARCMEDANYVRAGCGCSQPYPQACDAEASGCCGSKEQQTCCKGRIQIKMEDGDIIPLYFQFRPPHFHFRKRDRFQQSCRATHPRPVFIHFLFRMKKGGRCLMLLIKFSNETW